MLTLTFRFLAWMGGGIISSGELSSNCERIGEHRNVHFDMIYLCFRNFVAALDKASEI